MRKRFVRTMMITSMLVASLSLAACSKNEETDKGGLPTSVETTTNSSNVQPTTKGDAETTSKVEETTLDTSEDATTETNAEVTTPNTEATTPSEAPITKVEDETTTKVEEEATTNEPTTKEEPTTKVEPTTKKEPATSKVEKETTTKVEAPTKEKETTTTKVEPTTKVEATTKKEEATTKPASKPVEESPTNKPMEETPTQVSKDTVSRDKYGNASTYTFKGMHIAYVPKESCLKELIFVGNTITGTFGPDYREMADYVDANCGDGSKPNPYVMHEWTTRKYWGERDEVTVGYYCYYEDLYSDSRYDYNGVKRTKEREFQSIYGFDYDSDNIKIGTYEGRDVYFKYYFQCNPQ